MTEGLSDQIGALGEEVRNWGRWGDDDEIGTLNLITDDRRVAAARLIHRGRVTWPGSTAATAGRMPNGRRRL